MFQPFSPFLFIHSHNRPLEVQSLLPPLLITPFQKCPGTHVSPCPWGSGPSLQLLGSSFHHSHGCPLPLFKLPREGGPPCWTPTIPPTQMASSTPSPEIFLQSTPNTQGQGLILSGPLAITAFSLLRPTLPVELGLSTPTYSRGWWAGFSGYFGFLPLPTPSLGVLVSGICPPLELHLSHPVDPAPTPCPRCCRLTYRSSWLPRSQSSFTPSKFTTQAIPH